MPLSIPPGELMVPGQTYVGILPGDRRPSFVRKRPTYYRDRSTLGEALSNVFAPCRHRKSQSNKMHSWSRLDYYDSDYVYDYYPSRHPRYLRRRRVPVFSPDPCDPPTAKHSCAACGKFRSPAWSARHPLLPGEVPKPGLCRSCRGKSTSSEEDECDRHARKNHKHCQYKPCSNKHHHCSESSGDCYHTRSRRQPCPHNSHFHGDPVLTRPSSRESVNIFIDNNSGAQSRPHMVREPTSSTEEEIEIVRKRVPRARSRCSIVVDEVEEPPPRRKRSTSNIRVVKSRSQRRPVYFEEPEVWPRRRRHRSSSHVSFVDEPDEVIVSHSRKSSRTPRVYYDGANSEQYEPGGQIDIFTTRNNDSSEGSLEMRCVDIRLNGADGSPCSSQAEIDILDDGVGLIEFGSKSDKQSTSPKHSFAESSVVAYDHEPESNDMSRDANADIAYKHANSGIINNSGEDHSPIIRISEIRTGYLTGPTEQLEHQYNQERSLLQARGYGEDQPLLAMSEANGNELQPSAERKQTFCKAFPEFECPVISNDPAHPDHPDHFCWLVASDYIIPVGGPEGGINYVDNEASFYSCADTELATPTDSYVKDAWIQSINDRNLDDGYYPFAMPFDTVGGFPNEKFTADIQRRISTQEQEDLQERLRLQNIDS